MLRALAVQLILKLIDQLRGRAECGLTAEAKGKAITSVFEDQRHCAPRSQLALVFLITGLRAPFIAGRLARAVNASMSRLKRRNSSWRWLAQRAARPGSSQRPTMARLVVGHE